MPELDGYVNDVADAEDLQPVDTLEDLMQKGSELAKTPLCSWCKEFPCRCRK